MIINSVIMTRSEFSGQSEVILRAAEDYAIWADLLRYSWNRLEVG